MKHLAWIAGRGSTGRKQEDPLKHPARSVPRTRTRLLGARLRPTALATQATVQTPAENVARLSLSLLNLKATEQARESAGMF